MGMMYNAPRYDLSQLNLVGNPLNMVNPHPTQMTPPITPLMPVPPAMMKPAQEIPGSNLGFQMNPVSKNSKKK
jgi:hypothetical protein